MVEILLVAEVVVDLLVVVVAVAAVLVVVEQIIVLELTQVKQEQVVVEALNIMEADLALAQQVVELVATGKVLLDLLQVQILVAVAEEVQNYLLEMGVVV
jgi:hypothetical protein